MLGHGQFRRISRQQPHPKWFVNIKSTNCLAGVAIVLSVVNLGILMWQIWPEDSYTPPDRSFGYSAPAADFRDVTELRFR